ncbi:MAG: hypothetical protein M1454_03195 [Candidatus Thermoplasmatota archaeon]|nr:hypothetical protein [Candidatus Thermoplasmatota archaeon]
MVYEPHSKEDSFSVLAQGLCPGGVSKEKAHVNLTEGHCSVRRIQELV